MAASRLNLLKTPIRKMGNYKDEIYVSWQEDSEGVISSLCDYFTYVQQHDIEVHIFAQKKHVAENLMEWPDNFTFHFSETLSDHALSTALIAYALDKFQSISNELLPDGVLERKVKIFFIQKSLDQFEELKAMLVKKPFLTDVFSFKLLALSGEIKGSEFLFEKLKENKRNRTHNGLTMESKISRSISENGYSLGHHPIKHGRRADKSSNLPAKSLSLSNSSQPINFRSITRLSVPPADQKGCEHCDRRRGSKPGFSVDQKNLFCLACYLHKDDDEDKDLCKRCLRSKYYEMVDQETSIDYRHFSKNKGLQCGTTFSKLRTVATNTQHRLKSISVACQTNFLSVSEASQTDDQLHSRFHELMGKIKDEQDKLSNEVNGVDRKLSLGFRLNEIPKNPSTNKYHCPFCPTKLFDRLSIFEVHLKNVHKKCNCSCDLYFETMEAYLDHFYEVFPLHCFISRKCPDRFRTIHHQAVHHNEEHHIMKPYFCVPCFDKEQKVCYKDIKSLKNHAQYMNHDIDTMFFSLNIDDDDNETIPMTARSTAINYSG